MGAVQSPQQLHEPSTPQEMDTAPAFPQQVSPQQLRRRGLGILYRPSKAAEAAKRGGRCYSHLLTRTVVGTAQLMATWDHFFPLRCFPCKTKHGAGCTTDLENACGNVPQEQDLASSLSRGEAISTSTWQPVLTSPVFCPGFSVWPHRSEIQ